jgi:hypothetical protein
MLETLKANPDADKRHESDDRPSIGGVSVREDDIETVKGIRAVVYLFRGMTVLLLLLAAAQAISAITSTVPLSVGVVVAEEVRLLIFAGLLWVIGDLAVLWIKSHYDIRATKILVARMEYMMRQIGEADGKLPPVDGARTDREA